MAYYDKDRTDNPAPRMHSFPKPGLSSVAQYQISGMPAMDTLNDTSTTFTRVTSAITVWCTEAGGTISFGDTGQGVVTLPQNQAIRFEVMTTSLTAAGSQNVHFVAELTGIEASQKPDFDNSSNDVYSTPA